MLARTCLLEHASFSLIFSITWDGFTYSFTERSPSLAYSSQDFTGEKTVCPWSSRCTVTELAEVLRTSPASYMAQGGGIRTVAAPARRPCIVLADPPASGERRVGLVWCERDGRAPCAAAQAIAMLATNRPRTAPIIWPRGVPRGEHGCALILSAYEC